MKSFVNLLCLTVSCCLVSAIAKTPPVLADNFIPSEAEYSQISNVIDLDTRFNRLTQGINLSHWFSQTQDYSNHRLNTFITHQDLNSISSLGFQHVRLPIDPILLFNENDPTTLNSHYLDHLDRALNLIFENDLAVVVNLHTNEYIKEKLATDDSFVEKFSLFWGSLAKHLSSYSSDQVFLEIINEPAFNWFYPQNPLARWEQVQNQLIESIRLNAPDHTIIATSHDWSTIDSLVQLTPVADRNVVYNFHFYEPMVFTHQGADWIHENLAHITNLPYGVSDDECELLLPEIGNQKAVDLVYGYCQEEWNRDKIKARIGTVAAWANQHQVRVTANEFGANRFWVRPEDRMAWIHDVRSVLEEYDMGWTMWDYSGTFALAPRTDGIRTINPELVAALGLQEEVFVPPQGVPEPSAIAGLSLIAFLAKRKRFNHSSSKTNPESPNRA